MNAFFKKLKDNLTAWLSHRNGIDNLSYFCLWAGLGCMLLDSFLHTGLFLLIGVGLYGWAVFRTVSSNKYKRGEENRRFVNGWEETKRKIRQSFLRLKGRKQYKYFRCPKCRTLMRLNRGCGEKTINCPFCRHTFNKKA